MTQDKETHIAIYRKMSSAIKRAGMKSYALVAVDEAGEVYWGSSFGSHPHQISQMLKVMRHDVQDYLAKQARGEA